MLTAAGWGHAGATTQSRNTITTDFAAYTSPIVISRIQVIRNAPVDNGYNNIISIFEPVYPLSGTLGMPVETQNAVAMTNTFMGRSFDTMAIDVVADFLVGGVPVPGAIERIVYRGTGTNPFTGLP